MTTPALPEAARLALDALCMPCGRWNAAQSVKVSGAITALRTALAPAALAADVPALPETGIRLLDGTEVYTAKQMRAYAEACRAAKTAIVYPPDGTVSPFTVINLGTGRVQMGDAIHDQRLPALWFGTGGKGMGHEEDLKREAHEGETLAVVTFANVEGLDVLLDVVQRIRRLSFPDAPAAQAAPAAVVGDAENERQSLAMMLRKCAHALKNRGREDLAADVTGLLRRYGLLGSPLRAEDAASQPGPRAGACRAANRRGNRPRHD